MTQRPSPSLKADQFSSGIAARDARRRTMLYRLTASLVVLTAMLAVSNAQSHTTTTGGAIALPSGHVAGVGGRTDEPVVHHLLSALAYNDYRAFTGIGTPAFAAIPQTQFAQISSTVAARLQRGYAVQYLGNLRQEGLDISVWKISFADQGDDLLATLNVRDGRVGGFFLR